MAKVREVKRLVTGQRTTDGAGVALVRVLGRRDVVDFDPFLMLDAFDSTDPRDYVAGFPWHPHRGTRTRSGKASITNTTTPSRFSGTTRISA